MLFQVTAFLAAFLFSSMGIKWFRRWAEWKMLDVPNERSSHTNPTPRGGGIVIVIVTLISWSVYVYIQKAELVSAAYLAGAIFIAVISWIDDWRSVGSFWRFLCHSLAAALAIYSFGFWQQITVPFLPEIHLGWLGIPLTFIWIVGLTNAYNFMDGIDGIAGSQAVIASLGWVFIGSFLGVDEYAWLAGFLLATNLGFLIHNWPPAKIFMGDVASAFLGFTFAVFPLLIEQKAADLKGKLFFVSWLFVWPFVFDSVFTFFRRLARREKVWRPHRTHLYQRLLSGGFTHRFVTLLFGFLALCGMFSGLLWNFNIQIVQILILAAISFLFLALWRFVVWTEQKAGQIKFEN
jgi:UDP-N-acetylmuramyl pentapeptide phosphotransferase/UDP-N-acetylglucosamine-1-phosphate transferase